MGSRQDKMITTGTMDRVAVAPVKALEKFQDFESASSERRSDEKKDHLQNESVT